MKNVVLGIARILAYFLVWFIIIPINYVIPRKNNLITIIGRDDGRFVDNAKYLYIYLDERNDKKITFYFLTQNKEVFKELKQNNLSVILHPTVKSISTLLQTKVVFADSDRWINSFKYHLLFKSYKVQLWHAVPTKRIGLTRRDFGINNPGMRLNDKIKGRYCCYDLLISTSEYYTKILSSAFKAKEIIESGYPKNDSFFMEKNDIVLLGTDKNNINKVKKYKAEGCKVVLYAPTFRSYELTKYDVLNMDQLNSFAERNKIIFVFKQHFLPNHNLIYKKREAKCIIHYSNEKDIYPLLPVIDLLITDYSSIYLDSLLLDKPIIFFPYDYQEYYIEIEKSPFDYYSLTPGPKCMTQNDLEMEIETLLIQGIDGYKEKRKKILNMAFKYKDGKSSDRIWNLIEERYLRKEFKKFSVLKNHTKGVA